MITPYRTFREPSATMKQRDTIILILAIVVILIGIAWKLGADYVFHVAQKIADIKAEAEAREEAEDEARIRTEIETRAAIAEEQEINARRGSWSA